MDRSIPVWVAAGLALVVLMALPLGWIGWVSVSSESGPTLAHYATVFQDPQLQKALWNTVVMAFWVGLASVALGAPMAWLTARTDLPGQTLIRGLIMASFVTPPFLGAFAWVMLAGPNAGLLNKLYRNLSGADDALVNIFTMPGLIFVVAIYTFPYVYIMIANTLALIASDLEEAAAILGAGRLRVAATVTLPMVAPAILSGFILAVLPALRAAVSFPPDGVLAKAALSRAWAQPLTWDNLTLANFTFTFFEYSATQSAVLNTLELGVMTATVGAGLAALLAYVTNRRLIIGHQVLAFLALAPIVIPGVVLAVGLFIAYTRPPLLLYAPPWIPFFAYVA